MTSSQIGSAMDRTLQFTISDAAVGNIYKLGTIDGTSYYRFIVSSTDSVIYFEILGTNIVNIMSSGTGSFSIGLATTNNTIEIKGFSGNLTVNLLYTTGLFTFDGSIDTSSPTFLISRNFNISYYPITLSTSKLAVENMSIDTLSADTLAANTILLGDSWTITKNTDNKLIIKPTVSSQISN